MRFPHARILIFAKAPEAGLVKTRLIPALGAEGAADLYCQLLQATIQRIVSAEISPLICWCAPDTEHKVFQRLSRDYDISLNTQIGVDLGERMEYAASYHLEAGGPVVLIGGDCPELKAEHLLQTLDWLERDCDAVIGPAEDGGYVLLGLNKVSSELFRGIAWGRDSVLYDTRTRLQNLAWRWRELEPLWDLDRPVDIDRFRGMLD